MRHKSINTMDTLILREAVIALINLALHIASSILGVEFAFTVFAVIHTISDFESIRLN